MSGRSCLVCVSLLCLLVALVGRSRCPVAPASCPGRLQFFRVCFSVTSRAELTGHRPENRQFSVRYLPAAVKPDGYFPASVVGKRRYVPGLRFALPRGVAASTSPDVAAAAIVSEETSRRPEGRLLSVDKADCCVVRVCCEASYAFCCSVDTLFICDEPPANISTQMC